MSSFATPRTLCPNCGHTFDRAGETDKEHPRAPKPGDLGLCIECATVLQYDDSLRMRLIPPAELAEIYRQQPELAATVRKIAMRIGVLAAVMPFPPRPRPS